MIVHKYTTEAHYKNNFLRQTNKIQIIILLLSP